MKKTQQKSCPICGKQLIPHNEENGSVRYFCDCAGFNRPVIEILSEGEEPNDSTN